MHLWVVTSATMTAKKLDDLQVLLACDRWKGNNTLMRPALETVITSTSTREINRIAIIGGRVAGDYMNTDIYVYDIDENKWTASPDYHANLGDDVYTTPLFDGSAIICKLAQRVADDKVYIFHAENLGLNNFILEELGADSINAAIRNNTSLVTLPDGRVLRIDNDERLPRGAIFDPTTKQWTPITPPQVPGGALNIAMPNGDVFISGGYVNLPSVERACYIYHPQTNTLDRVADMILRRYRHAGCMLPNGNIFVCGGFTHLRDMEAAPGEDIRTLTQTCEEYDVATNTWALLSTLPGSRAYTQRQNTVSWLTNVESISVDHACTLMRNGKILISGGSGVRTPCKIYDPEKKTFKQAARFPVNVHSYLTVPLYI